jgi:NADPH:quinone reductase-like Zn-dependent oxidoreductase
VTRFQPGEEVFGMPWFPRQAGAYAEYVTAPSRQFAHKPGSIDHVHAASLPVASLTAWQALVDTARIKPGQKVLVHAAAGGIVIPVPSGASEATLQAAGKAGIRATGILVELLEV